MLVMIHSQRFLVSVFRAGFYLIPLLFLSQQIDLFLADWKAMESHLSVQSPKQIGLQSNYLSSSLFQNANLVAVDKPWFYPDNGCTMFNYTQRETKVCMKEAALKNARNLFVFVGDSKVRMLFDAFNYLVGIKYKGTNNKHSDETVKDTKDNREYYAEFRWTPYLFEGVSLFANTHERIMREKPTFVVHEAALWDIRRCFKDPICYTHLKGNLTLLVQSIKLITQKVPYLWMSLDPVRYERLDKTRLMLTNEAITNYDNLIAKTLNGSGATMWYSSQQVARAVFKTGYKDALHLYPTAARYKAQILLNWHCNKYNVQKSLKPLCFVENNQPETTTTLKNNIISFISERLNWLRVISAVIVLLAVFTVSFFTQSVEKGMVDASGNILPWLSSVCKLLVIMGYIYMCKSKSMHCDNKYNGLVLLAVLVVLFVIVGLVCTEKTLEDQILNRRQTDEWKGLLAFIFIITSIAQHGGPRPESLFTCHIVSSYLFLTGFGHFTYFWTTEDFSCRRVFKTLIRLNFTILVVCLVTRTPYMAHPIFPLVTVWFLCIYITMASWPRHNFADDKSSEKRCCKIMTAKLFVVFIFTTLASYLKSYFSNLLHILGVSTSYGPQFWEYDWALQRYSVLSGMAFGLLYQYCQREWPTKCNSLLTMKSNVKTIIIAAMCIPGFVIGGMFTSTCILFGPCEYIYPYISVVPVISYVVIRNLRAEFRSRYNYVFAWFGQITLELYIAFYHIWMTRCNGYIIELVPGFPVVNMATTTLILIIVCFYLREITLSITSLLECKSRHGDALPS